MLNSDRKHPTHGINIIPAQATLVLVTACTEKRQPWLAHDDVYDVLRQVWASADGWLVGQYVIMPDHVHFFVTLGRMDISLERWCKYWKSQFSNRYLHAECSWQTDHWDIRMRSAEHYHEKLAYVRENPVRKGLVQRAEDWPYRGEIHALSWEG